MGEAKRRSFSGEESVPGRRRRRRRWLVGGAIAVLALLGVGLLYLLTTPSISPLNDLPRAADGAPPFPAELDRYGVSLGDPAAPVVVREFADYQCPACAHFSEMAQRLKKDYIDTGKVRLVYFDFPLQQHRNAVPAAQAARCAGDQDAYWPMHTMLFNRQSDWAEESGPAAVFSGYAKQLKLDQALFDRCMSSGRHLNTIQRSLQAAQQLRLSSTPSVFVDNIPLTQPGWYQLAGVVGNQLDEKLGSENNSL